MFKLNQMISTLKTRLLYSDRLLTKQKLQTGKPYIVRP